MSRFFHVKLGVYFLRAKGKIYLAKVNCAEFENLQTH